MMLVQILHVYMKYELLITHFSKKKTMKERKKAEAKKKEKKQKDAVGL